MDVRKFKPKPKLSPDIETWLQALKAITQVITQLRSDTKFKYAVTGSSAYLIHGLKFKDPNDNPFDIDIVVNNPMLARKALSQCENFKAIESEISNKMVGTFIISLPTGKSIKLNLNSAEDFGFSSLMDYTKDGIYVTSLVSTLKSLYLRPEAREKDIFAFKELINIHSKELATDPELKNVQPRDFREAVEKLIFLYNDEELKQDPEALNAMVDENVTEIFAPNLKNLKASYY